MLDAPLPRQGLMDRAALALVAGSVLAALVAGPAAAQDGMKQIDPPASKLERGRVQEDGVAQDGMKQLDPPALKLERGRIQEDGIILLEEVIELEDPPGSPAEDGAELEAPDEAEAVVPPLTLLGVLDRHLPPLTNAPYVRVRPTDAKRARACCFTHGAPSPEGFLVAEDADSFTVVHGLFPITYLRGPADKAAREFEVLDFPAALDALLAPAVQRARGADGVRPAALGWGRLVRRCARPSAPFDLVLLARAADACGLAERRDALLSKAAKTAVRSRRPLSPQGLLTELARTLLYETIEAFGSDTAHAELLARFQRLAHELPDSQGSAAAAREYASALELLSAPTRPPEAGPPDLELGTELRELARPTGELVAQLKDVRRLNFTATSRGRADDEDAAVATLFELGWSAVPTLLELIDDRRPTRVVNLYASRRAEPKALVLRYGDVALRLLSVLAGRSFDDRAEADAWWRAAQTLGPDGALAASVRAGEGSTARLAERLWERDPRTAIEAALEAARAAEGRAREQLVSFVGRSPAPEVHAFLLGELRRDDPRPRLAAARILAERGDPAWIQALVDALERTTDGATRPWQGSAAVTRPILQLLCKAGGPSGLNAASQLYPRLSPAERRYLLDAAGQVGAADVDLREAAEALLAEALTDDEPLEMVWTGLRVRMMDPLLGEVAAVLLSDRGWGSFDPAGPPAARARARVLLANRWRGARGQPLLPVPELPPLPAAASAEVLAPLKEHLDEARSGPERAYALARFAELGLSGAAALREQLAAHEPVPGALHVALRPTLVKLASTVAAVELPQPSAAEDAEARSKLHQSAAALAGAPLSAEQVIDLLRRFLAGSGSATLSLHLHRDGAGRGVTLALQTQGEDRGPQVQLRYVLRQGERTMHPQSRRLPRDAADRPETWSALEKQLSKVLEASPDQDGELRLRLSRRDD